MSYTIVKHKHRFAAWAASRAASVNGCRFTVEHGRRILEGARLHKTARTVDDLPQPSGFDRRHRRWRKGVIRAAQEYQPAFTHGVAAKLINIYLKSVFICGGNHEDPRIKAIHPPIDSLLLDALYRNDIGGRRCEWQTARKIRWSKLDCEQYEDVISSIRQTVPEGSGLWEIEEYWQGFQ